MTILVGTYFSVYDEFDYFNYNAHFDDIVTIATLLRSLPNVDKLLESETTLSCDMCLMQPLFVTAIKCRKSATRTMAVAIMQSIPLREGTWFTQQVANLAMQMIKAEEDGTMNYVPDRSTLIPLCARVVDTTIQDFALNGSDATGNKKMMEIVTMCEICLKGENPVMDSDDWMKKKEDGDDKVGEYIVHTLNPLTLETEKETLLFTTRFPLKSLVEYGLMWNLCWRDSISTSAVILGIDVTTCRYFPKNIVHMVFRIMLIMSACLCFEKVKLFVRKSFLSNDSFIMRHVAEGNKIM